MSYEDWKDKISGFMKMDVRGIQENLEAGERQKTYH